MMNFNNLPKISVIMPAYNCGNYIGQAIESVLNQTEASIELIIVDDASTDDTLSIVSNYDDSRIRIFSNTTNYGQSFCRNRAIKEAKGIWVAFLDADDWCDLNRLEMLLFAANHENAEMVMDPLFMVRDGEKRPYRIIGRHAKGTTAITPLEYVTRDYGVLQPIIKRSHIVDNNILFNTDNCYGEDFAFSLQCLLYGAKMVLTSTPHYYYRLHNMSTMNNSATNTLERLYESTQYLLSTDIVRGNEGVYQALSKRLENYSQRTVYAHFVAQLKYAISRKAIGDARHLIIINRKILWSLLKQKLSYKLMCLTYRISTIYYNITQK